MTRFAHVIPFLFVISYCSSTPKKDFATPADQFVDASERGDEDLVKNLIAQGGNVNQRNGNGYTPLMSAAERGRLSIVTQLIAAGANVNLVNKFSWTALMLAAVGGHTDVAQALINAKANVRYRSPTGETALQLAERDNNAGLISILKQAGAR